MGYLFSEITLHEFRQWYFSDWATGNVWFSAQDLPVFMSMCRFTAL